MLTKDYHSTSAERHRKQNYFRESRWRDPLSSPAQLPGFTAVKMSGRLCQPIRVGREHIRQLEAEPEGVYKGTEIDLSSGAVYDAEIRHAVSRASLCAAALILGFRYQKRL